LRVNFSTIKASYSVAFILQDITFLTPFFVPAKATPRKIRNRYLSSKLTSSKIKFSYTPYSEKAHDVILIKPLERRSVFLAIVTIQINHPTKLLRHTSR